MSSTVETLLDLTKLQPLLPQVELPPDCDLLPQDALALTEANYQVLELHRQNRLDVLTQSIAPDGKTPHTYEWNTALFLELRRLIVQNGDHGPWGIASEEALQTFLLAQNPNPDLIAHFGIGGDAGLAIRAARLAPGAKIECFDFSQPKVHQAQFTIAQAGLTDRITVHYTDVAAILDPEQNAPYRHLFGQANAVVAQCFFQHCTSQSARAAILAAKKISRPDGLLIASDLTLDGQEDWHVTLSQTAHQNPSLISYLLPLVNRANEFIHGSLINPDQFSAKSSYLDRGAHYWATPQEMINSISSQDPNLQLVGAPISTCKSFHSSLSDPKATISLAIPTTIALGIHGAAANIANTMPKFPQKSAILAGLETKKQQAFTFAEFYSREIIPNTHLIVFFPRMHTAAFSFQIT